MLKWVHMTSIFGRTFVACGCLPLRGNNVLVQIMTIAVYHRQLVNVTQVKGIITV